MRVDVIISRIVRPLKLLFILILVSSCAEPTANPGGPYSADIGQAIAFDGSRSAGAAGQTLTYAWDFGDGSIGAGETTTHAYTAAGTFTVALTVTDRNGGTNTTSTTAAVSSRLPPDPSTVAPPLNTTVATTIGSSTAFLYSGANPIQTGVPTGTIVPTRAAVLRGKVIDKTNAALPGVTISILNHKEFGQTLSRADGMFDLAVNGGGLLIVNYEKAGFLSAQRQVQVFWQDFAFAPDVVLVPPDGKVTTIDLSSTAPVQVARGTAMSDNDGTRQATLPFPQGTEATMFMRDGSSRPLTTMSVRATEFTVGDNGPQSMPAELPTTSAYTYAAEFNADEAIAAGAAVTKFSQPVPVYLENFLNYPVGVDVPVGAYDQSPGGWVPEPNGRILKILSVTNGLADLDTTGNGSPDEGTAIGVTLAERQQLAGLYQPGQTLWRVPVAHFSNPYDFNYGYYQPPDAVAPPVAPPTPVPPDDPDPECGSIIGCETQTLGEAIRLVGTPLTLHYDTRRVPGLTTQRTINVPLSGPSVPASLASIILEVDIAGQRNVLAFPAAPNQNTTFTWNGKDVYGRTVQGTQIATVSVGYTYRGILVRSPCFACTDGG
jgi:PKD repeat protein